MKAALYARISKAGDQTPENQLMQLRDYAKEAGITVYGEFVDEVSSRDTRPQKEEVLRLARLHLIDTIIFVRLDRWGRNLAELAVEMQSLPDAGIKLVSLNEGMTFDTAYAKLHAGLLALFAQFERDVIHERTVAGLRRAKAQGKRLGRHPRNCDCEKHLAASIAARKARSEERERLSAKGANNTGGVYAETATTNKTSV